MSTSERGIRSGDDVASATKDASQPGSAEPATSDVLESAHAKTPRDDKNATRGRVPFVLVVDDHVDTREGYAEYLRMAGFRTAQASTGVSAITLARSMHPDAILLDYAMPMMDGVQAAICLKRDADTGNIPIVMLTAYGDIVNGRGGCDHYLDKPCDPRDVVKKLRSVLHLGGDPAGEA